MTTSVDETLSLATTLKTILARVKPVPDNAYEVNAELEEAHRAHRRRRYLIGECGLPEKEAERLLGHAPLLETPSLEAARSFREAAMDPPPPGAPAAPRCLVLAGPPGVGKTTAAAWLVAEGPPRPYMLGAVDRRRDPRVGSSWPRELHPRFIAASDFATMSPIDHEGHRALRCCSILGLDDLGMEIIGDSGAVLARLDALIDARYRQQVWTVLTTNCAIDEFAERYGRRIMSRLTELTGGVFELVPGEDLR